MSIENATKFSYLSLTPTFFLCEPLTNFAVKCDGVRKSRNHFFWIVPVNLIACGAAIPLTLLTATINGLASALFAIIALATKGSDHEGWIKASKSNLKGLGGGLLLIAVVFFRIFIPAAPLGHHPGIEKFQSLFFPA